MKLNIVYLNKIYQAIVESGYTCTHHAIMLFYGMYHINHDRYTTYNLVYTSGLCHILSYYGSGGLEINTIQFEHRLIDDVSFTLEIRPHFVMWGFLVFLKCIRVLV